MGKKTLAVQGLPPARPGVVIEKLYLPSTQSEASSLLQLEASFHLGIDLTITSQFRA
jgi:hypothetical protein